MLSDARYENMKLALVGHDIFIRGGGGSVCGQEAGTWREISKVNFIVGNWAIRNSRCGLGHCDVLFVSVAIRMRPGVSNAGPNSYLSLKPK
jgi:hypothetical protein